MTPALALIQADNGASSEEDGFRAEDFLHTRDLLLSDNEKVVKATLSNNYNIILAALVRAAAVQHLIDSGKRQ